MEQVVADEIQVISTRYAVNEGIAFLLTLRYQRRNGSVEVIIAFPDEIRLVFLYKVLSQQVAGVVLDTHHPGPVAGNDRSIIQYLCV